MSRRWDDIADSEKPPDEKRTLLVREKERLASARSTTTDDPVLIAVQHTVSTFRIPWSYFFRLLKGVRMDLYRTRYNSFRDLLQYCYHVASVPGLIVLEIFGYRDDEARTHATSLGYAMQLTNILRDVRKDLNRNRIYLPRDEMNREGVQPDQLQPEDPTPEPLKNVARRVGDRARQYFRRAQKLFPLLVPSSRTCPLILMNLYRTILRKIEKRNYRVLDQPVQLNTLEKCWVLFSSLFFHPSAV